MDSSSTDICRRVDRGGFVHAHRHYESGRDGDRGGGPDCGAQPPQVGGDAADDGAGGISTVTPQSVDPDGAGPPQRVGDVTDGGQQCRVDHCGARTEQRGRREPPREGVGGGYHRQPSRLGEHPSGDQMFATPSVRQCTYDELTDAPHCRVHSDENSDAVQGIPVVANRIGNSPHDSPKLRLLTRPAWLAADSAGSVIVVRRKICRLVSTVSGWLLSCWLASSSAWPRVSRTSTAVSPRAISALDSPSSN